MKTTYKIGIIIGILVIAVATYEYANQNSISKTTIGSNSKGYVTKVVYSFPDSSNPKIAVITGMHSRETSSKEVVPKVIKDYAFTHHVDIVNYQINVTDDPMDFTIGRHNGESLVAEYVVPDIAKSNYNLVIICHNHRQGYGNGYYIATPTMDSKSVSLAESVHNFLPGFNYYKRNVDQKPEETSIKGVDAPIVSTGTPVFVYEAPEWLNNSDVYDNTDQLINACFKVIG